MIFKLHELHKRNLCNWLLLILDFLFLQVKKMAKLLARDPTYKEKREHYLFDDLMCMSDFQIHQLTLTHNVSTVT